MGFKKLEMSKTNNSRGVESVKNRLLKMNRNESKEDLIEFVEDRPGHDFRYAIDASKIANDLQWTPTENFQSGIKKTVKWYLENYHCFY